MNLKKVCIGMRLMEGPWGGGNAVISALSKYLSDKGVEVAHDLSLKNADVILLTDPRRYLKSCAFGARDIGRYQLRNDKAIIVHRINECDERKGTVGLDRKIIRSNRCADHTVFVSSWLRDNYLDQGLRTPSESVILNASDSRIFNRGSYRVWNRDGPVRLVTHHWGANWLKGFDIYQKLDCLIGQDEYRGKIQFTYIGNLPEQFSFQNTTVIPPLSGAELAKAISENHVYLTASRSEPGSNHQNEGASCGLPLLYISSGCLPEYCAGFGIEFRPDNFINKLTEMIDNYDYWAKRMQLFNRSSDDMCSDYFELFESLLNRKKELLPRRRLWSWRLKTLAIAAGID